MLKAALILQIAVALTVLSPLHETHAAEPTYSVTVVTDREDALYEVGEEATFLISVTSEKKPVTDGTVSFVVDDFLMGGKTAGLPEGTASLNESPIPVTVKGRGSEFLRCQVTSSQQTENHCGRLRRRVSRRKRLS